jgi:hypothetical protein
LVQLQNNRFGKNEFSGETAKNKFALFDFDENNRSMIDFSKVSSEKDVRTAETRFEDGLE